MFSVKGLIFHTVVLEDKVFEGFLKEFRNVIFTEFCQT